MRFWAGLGYSCFIRLCLCSVLTIIFRVWRSQICLWVLCVPRVMRIKLYLYLNWSNFPLMVSGTEYFLAEKMLFDSERVKSYVYLLANLLLLSVTNAFFYGSRFCHNLTYWHWFAEKWWRQKGWPILCKLNQNLPATYKELKWSRSLSQYKHLIIDN